MILSTQRAPLIIFSFQLGRRIRAQTCYYPDQTVEPSYKVCNASAQISLCCQEGETCLTNGLCFSRWDTSLNTGACTDKTWTSPSCFQECSPSLWTDGGFYTLYRCNYNRWCCSNGDNTTSCCNDGGVELFPLNDAAFVMGGTGFLPGFTIAPVELLQSSTSTAGSSVLATPGAIDLGAAKPQSSAAANNNTDGKASASDVTKTGLGAGLGIGIPLLAGLIVALLFLRRLRIQNNAQKIDSEKKTADIVVDGDIMARSAPPDMESLPSEMPISRRETTRELGV